MAQSIAEARKQTFDPVDIEKLVAKSHSNVWVPRETIVTASLRRGIITSRLAMDLSHGRRIKFLWRRPEGDFDFVRDTLERWLAHRLSVT
jgi:hypothetical protein